jgi:hypothetical protein
MVVFKSPRDQTVISTLARQMYPGCGQYLIEAYKDATEKAYSYQPRKQGAPHPRRDGDPCKGWSRDLPDSGR